MLDLLPILYFCFDLSLKARSSKNQEKKTKSSKNIRSEEYANEYNNK